MNTLTVFPSELAMRRFQQEEALRSGFVDASGQTTFARLRQVCLPYANLKGEPLTDARRLLLRRQVVELAKGHFIEGGPLGRLSDSALGRVLDQLVSEMAALPEETQRIIDWLLDHPPRHKLYQLGYLFSIWRVTLQQEGFVDELGINTAVLKLLKGSREEWPPLLRDAKKIVFRAVRWLAPFEEACVVALDRKMKVEVESLLPPAHAEEAEDRLGQAVRSKTMEWPWAGWVENLADALAVKDSDLIQPEDTRYVAFSRSAGTYGEIEDLARRICWSILEEGVEPHRVALVVPDISKVQDIVPHVFGRFRIPYHFRRGRPVLSSAPVKAFFALLSFPLRPERDALADLLRNPAIAFQPREETVEALLEMPPLLDPRETAKALPQTAPFFRECRSGEQAARLLKERMEDVTEDDHFNSRAIEKVAETLGNLGKQSIPLRDLVDVAEELLASTTIRPREGHEQGVWIVNPDDAAGLEFDLVLVAGLNEREFPSPPSEDALLSDSERNALRGHLEEQGRRLPLLVLPSSSTLFALESIRFLSAIGMARRQLVFSFQGVDSEGCERNESEYYRKLWNLAGWPARQEIEPCPYDRWRISALPEPNLFSSHWKAQRGLPREERVPMPGESFLPVVPLPLCRARDEALQAAAHAAPAPPPSVKPSDPGPAVGHLAAMLRIEAERDAFLDTPPDERPPSPYCGHIPGLKERIEKWLEQKGNLSPTALEKLAENRYAFLLEQVLGIREARAADDAPDPMRRGGMVHSILREIYAAIAAGEAVPDAPRLWAVKTSNGWIRRTSDGKDAIPLAVFAEGREEEYVGFARERAKRRLEAEVLGHPGIWGAEREKLLETIVNFVRFDAQNCAAENRFPALFELSFQDLELPESVRVRGKIDRIDLVFRDSGELERIRVLDYKGPGRARNKTEEYLEEIRHNLDCQLPIYAFAAQRHFLGEYNIPEANAMTEAGYLFYQREFKKLGGALRKSLVPMDTEGLAVQFLETLAQNIQCLKAGDFAVDPLIAGYTDYESVCRTGALERADLGTQP